MNKKSTNKKSTSPDKKKIQEIQKNKERAKKC